MKRELKMVRNRDTPAAAVAEAVAKARAEYPGFDADRAAYGLATALYNAGFAAGWEAAKAESTGGGK